MQVPAISSDAVLPLTVQTVGVVDAKLTANPELAVAMSESLVAAVCAAIAPNIIVCAFSTLNDSETEAAAAYVPLPACDAVIVHVPLPLKVAVLPESEHTVEGVAE